jgi:hypothetical protein
LGRPLGVRKRSDTAPITWLCRKLWGNGDFRQRNQGKRPETLQEAGIRAWQEIDGKRVGVRVFRYDELVQEEETRQKVAAFRVLDAEPLGEAGIPPSLAVKLADLGDLFPVENAAPATPVAHHIGQVLQVTPMRKCVGLQQLRGQPGP